MADIIYDAAAAAAVAQYLNIGALHRRTQRAKPPVHDITRQRVRASKRIGLRVQHIRTAAATHECAPQGDGTFARAIAPLRVGNAQTQQRATAVRRANQRAVDESECGGGRGRGSGGGGDGLMMIQARVAIFVDGSIVFSSSSSSTADAAVGIAVD